MTRRPPTASRVIMWKPGWSLHGGSFGLLGRERDLPSRVLVGRDGRVAYMIGAARAPELAPPAPRALGARQARMEHPLCQAFSGCRQVLTEACPIRLGERHGVPLAGAEPE